MIKELLNDVVPKNAYSQLRSARKQLVKNLRLLLAVGLDKLLLDET